MRQNLRRDDFKRIQRRAGEPKKSNLQRDAETVQRASMSPYRVKLILGEREELRNLGSTQSFRKTLTAQIGSMIYRHDSILPEYSLHIPGKRSKTTNPRKSAIITARFQCYHTIPNTCLAALFALRSREPHGNMRMKETALARATAPAMPIGRFQPDDQLLAFLEGL